MDPDRVAIRIGPLSDELPRWFVPTLRLLIACAERWCTRDLSVLISDTHEVPIRRRKWKQLRSGRRVGLDDCLGLYHPRRGGEGPMIELFANTMLDYLPPVLKWIPVFRQMLLAQVFYHELGHHIQIAVWPERGDREAMADKWQGKLSRRFLQRHHPLLVRVLRIVFFWRRKAGRLGPAR